MGDYWTEHPEELQGQPKLVHGDYVESDGILVPIRFANIKKGKTSGLPLIYRNEHQQDYEGVSGLLDSPILDEFDYFEIKDITNED